MLSIKSPKDVAQSLAVRLRERRLTESWSREELARRSGVSAAYIKRFELQAEISLSKLSNTGKQIAKLFSHRPF